MCNLSSAIEERGNKQGFERGDKQGFERGTHQTKKDIVFELKNMLSIEEIAKVTKLPVEDVKKILSETQE